MKHNECRYACTLIIIITPRDRRVTSARETQRFNLRLPMRRTCVDRPGPIFVEINEFFNSYFTAGRTSKRPRVFPLLLRTYITIRVRGVCCRGDVDAECPAQGPPHPLCRSVDC